MDDDDKARDKVSEALRVGAEYGVAMMRVLQESGMPFGRESAFGAMFVAAMITQVARKTEATEEQFVSMCQFVWRSTHTFPVGRVGGDDPVH